MLLLLLLLLLLHALAALRLLLPLSVVRRRLARVNETHRQIMGVVHRGTHVLVHGVAPLREGSRHQSRLRLLLSADLEVVVKLYKLGSTCTTQLFRHLPPTMQACMYKDGYLIYKKETKGR